MNHPALKINRRQFVTASLAAFGATSVATGTAAATGPDQARLTVQQVIDLILDNIPGGRLGQTVDTLKAGRADQTVNGIVTTMFATVDVIRRAIELKADFIIVHEPTFYSHLDETAWLENDKVFMFKKKLLDDHGIAVWRFHDYWHRNDPDGVRFGVLKDLAWDRYYDARKPGIIALPPAPLKDIIRHVKAKLGIQAVRIIGDPLQVCERIGLMPGASGGRSHISLLMREEPDLLICGEVAEWETSEYIRDAISMGLRRSLLVLGHAQSEEPGMDWLVHWLQPKTRKIPVVHVASNNPFTFA